MNSRYKKFLKSGIITPVIISVVLSAIFFATVSQLTKLVPFYNQELALSDYEMSEVKTIEYSQQSATIRKSELKLNELDDNTIIGSATINDACDIEIIYNANDYNASSRLNLADDNIIFGQSGCTMLSATRQYGSELKMLNKGDSVVISAFYGEYTYKVTDTIICKNASKLKRADGKLASSLIIYTDAENSVGIGNSYYAVVCELVNGSPVKE